MTIENNAPNGFIDRLRGTRKRSAFLVHLLSSASVVGVVAALIFCLWYPHPYFQAAGAWNVLRILIGVDLILGPLLTLMLFRPHKPWLLLDLSVIACIQLAALIYGVTVIYQERPYYTVFAVDRFHVLALSDVDRDAAAEVGFADKPPVGPRLVAASLPEDPDALQRLLEEVLFEGKPDIERRPEFWSPYAERRRQISERAAPLARLIDARPEAADRIERLVRASGRPVETLGYLPLVAKHRDFAFVVDAGTGVPVDVIDVDPWTVNAP